MMAANCPAGMVKVDAFEDIDQAGAGAQTLAKMLNDDHGLSGLHVRFFLPAHSRAVLSRHTLLLSEYAVVVAHSHSSGSGGSLRLPNETCR